MDAIYHVRTGLDAEFVAAAIAKEQSAGNSANWEGISSESRDAGRAEVVSVNRIESRVGLAPTYTSRRANGPAPSPTPTYEIVVHYNNWQPECGLANLANVVVGEPQHLDVVDNLRWISFKLSPAELATFKGPRYGAQTYGDGSGRDLLVAPIKPSAGLTSSESAGLAYEAAMGGADVLKDDELAFPGLRVPVQERAKAIIDVLQRATQETGERKYYWANIIGSPRKAFELSECLQDLGVDGLLVAPTVQGLDICHDLGEIVDLPLIAHNIVSSLMTRVTTFGMSYAVWVQIQRLAGADFLLSPSPYGSFGIDPDECGASLDAATEPLGGLISSCFAHSGGVSDKTIPMLHRLRPQIRVSYTAGSAIFDHPKGPREGARTLRRVIENLQAREGVS